IIHTFHKRVGDFQKNIIVLLLFTSIIEKNGRKSRPQLGGLFLYENFSLVFSIKIEEKTLKK
ncbi:hypothetical protein, partial [Lactococcus garvieae]|uniref:hypothetical protein n=1 Tax=Lactococcus garvieae TaxID=1363 RepID=UPI00254E5769